MDPRVAIILIGTSLLLVALFYGIVAWGIVQLVGALL
jgi:hypothetical protein